jgi:phospholipase/carboxylesterase
MVRKPRAQMPHCLLAPMHYEPNYAYPLVIWLHDCGGDERELKRVMPLVSLRNYVSLSLRGTAEAAPAEGSRHRHGFDWPETADGILAAESRIADGIAQARQRFNVHPNRIFLAGHGSGGTLALRLGLRNPRQYAGAASIGGSFPSGHAPLARLAEARRSHLLIMHCRDSLSYPIACLCSELSLFHAAGMSVTMRQYPCGDELTTQMLRDLDAWLMEQVTGVPSTADQEHAPLPSQWN